MSILPSVKENLLSSTAVVQVPWIKVTIGDYTFGVYSGPNSLSAGDAEIDYPKYIKQLQVTKINGQINRYSLSIVYPVTLNDDPNFFEKVFSSAGQTRKIVFSYGDASVKSLIYKEEEAIITEVKETFSFGSSGNMSSAIGYNISAVSACALSNGGTFDFTKSGIVTPSEEIKKVLLTEKYGLKKLLPGINSSNINDLIEGGDKPVEIKAKHNMSALDYVNYLVGCMVPNNTTTDSTTPEMYILTFHDEKSQDEEYNTTNGKKISGAYAKITKTSNKIERSDAYNVDIGINTSTIVTNFSIKNDETYSLYFDYQEKLNDKKYVRRINNSGQIEEVFGPNISSDSDTKVTQSSDTVWWTKLTKYPISAELTVQGLLRPAMLMQYIRLNVIFPGGKKHISSGLYIVTKQTDTISESGYRTQLSLTRLET